MKILQMKPWRTAFLILGAVIVLLSGCSSNGSGGTCDQSTTHTVEWRFSGSFDQLVSVATTWVKASGEFSDPADPKYAHIDPANGTLLTETLPGCTGASINITMLDGGADDIVTLSNVTLSIYVDGALADSVTLNGSYSESTILPADGALEVVVGE